VKIVLGWFWVRSATTCYTWPRPLEQYQRLPQIIPLFPAAFSPLDPIFAPVPHIFQSVQACDFLLGVAVLLNDFTRDFSRALFYKFFLQMIVLSFPKVLQILGATRKLLCWRGKKRSKNGFANCVVNRRRIYLYSLV
jgi:hypothetical protein